MRRWWIFHFGPGEEPYQINLLGLVIGIPLGLIGALVGFAIGGRQNADGPEPFFGGVIMALPFAIPHGFFSELLFGTPIKNIGTRIGLIATPLILGGACIAAHPESINIHKVGYWLVMGAILGGFFGANTQQYEYPPSKRMKRKRKRRATEKYD